MLTRSKIVAVSATGLSALLCGILALAQSPVSAQESGKPAKGLEPAANPEATGSQPQKVFNQEEATAELDNIISAKWEEQDLKPSDAATDHEWLRRIYLDLIGRAPKLLEAESWLARREELEDEWRTTVIDDLLETPNFNYWWARFWEKAMIANGGQDRNRGTQQFQNWLSEQMKINRPYDELVREIISTTDKVDISDPRDASPAGYYMAFDNDVNNLTGNLSRAFLGIEIQCVQCHDDKLGEPWNQPDFRGMAAIFKGTRIRRVSNDRSDEYYDTYQISDSKVQSLGRRQRERLEKQAESNPAIADRLAILLADPKPLGQEPLEVESGEELRGKLAAWLTSDANPWFARTAVNRVWGHLMKRGIVDPIDDFSLINTPSNPELLEFLADDFKRNGYDMQRLIRVIVDTRAYQLSSETNRSNADDRLFYSRGFTRQLNALELLGSLFAVTNVGGTLEKVNARNVDGIKRAVVQQFTTTFEDDEGREQESFTGTIPQALLMMNGDFVSTAAGALPGGTLFSILRHQKTVEDRVDRMYLAALTREPESDEARTMVRYIKQNGGVVSAYEDVFWALLNSAEFLNNH